MENWIDTTGYWTLTPSMSNLLIPRGDPETAIAISEDCALRLPIVPGRGKDASPRPSLDLSRGPRDPGAILPLISIALGRVLDLS
jgi:hypothetical protein